MVTKHSVEKLIVPRPGTTIPAVGTRLYNLTTGALNLPVGCFGVFVDVPGSGNPVLVDGTTNVVVLGTTPGTNRPFRIIMRRDVSNDATVLYDRYFEQSDYIDNDCILGVQYAAEPFSAPQVNSWLLGPQDLTAFSIDNTKKYSLAASASGYRTDMVHSVYNTPTTIGYVDGSETDAVTGAEDKMDFLIKGLAKDFNRKNSVGLLRNGFAIALDASDGDNTTAGTTIAAIIAAGVDQSYIIGYDQGCNPVMMLVTADRLQAFTALEAWAVNASGLNIGAGDLRIAPYAFRADGCTSAVELAGEDVSAAKFLYIMAIDEALAPYDEITQTKKSLTVALAVDGVAVNTDTKLVTAPNEGTGKARDLRIMWENTEEYRSYTSSKSWGANHVAFPNEILANEAYDVYSLAHCANRMATSGMPSVSPHWTGIALVHTNRAEGTTPQSTGAANAHRTYLQAVLNAYATAWGLPTITL